MPHQANFRAFSTRQLPAALAIWLIAALLAVPQATSANPLGESPADPTGEWLVAKRVARIKIVNCDNHFWGVLSWEMTPGVDSNNPDHTKRTRPTLGMPILLGMVPNKEKENEWKGEIYNAEDGRNYSASISLLNPDLLKVQGCVLGILCGGENWTRVPPANTSAPPPAPKSSAPKSAPASKSAAKKTNSPTPDEALCLDLTGSAGPSH